MAELIENYEVQLVEPGCAPGASRWNALVVFPGDISRVFPYLNARFEGIWYDHENETLIWREGGQTLAFRPRKIRIAQVEDPADAERIVREIIGRLNRVWREREGITPRYTTHKPPSVLEIFKLLPRTNCGQCGYATCMACAADLSRGQVTAEQCPPLGQPEQSANKEKLTRLLNQA